MSDLQDIIAHNAQRAYQQGVDREHQRIVQRLTEYLELCDYSTEAEGGDDNPEWDRGFQAALAIVRTDLPIRTAQEVIADPK